MLSIGLMSGTSMDGIDCALLQTNGEDEIKELGHTFLSYDDSFKILLKSAEYAIRHCQDLEKAKSFFPEALKSYLQNEFHYSEENINLKIAELSAYFQGELSLENIILLSTTLHSIAVKKLLGETGLSPNEISVVGYHGQAMFHQSAQKISIIVGDGQVLANHLGIKVVNDFRSQDIANGGQGAPFAPLYHQALALRDEKVPLAVLNCGGIANITVISNHHALDLIAFDTGPGNGLIDKFIRQRTNGKEHMDKNGQYGLKGKINLHVLNALFEKSLIKNHCNYFSMQPPKSLDIGDMKLIPELEDLSLEDGAATLEAFTAESIIRSLDFIDAPLPSLWVLAGGGWKNPVIAQEFTTRLQKKLGNQMKVQNADAIGWNSQALEAQIFAYLAVRTLQNKPLSVPKTTGVIKPMTGGQLYFPDL